MGDTIPWLSLDYCLQALDGEDSFDSPGSPETVTDIRFVSRHEDLCKRNSTLSIQGLELRSLLIALYSQPSPTGVEVACALITTFCF